MLREETIGGVAVLRLDRPEKRNALTPGMLESLERSLVQLETAAAIVIGGVGDVFCAGFDLALCRDDDDALRELLSGLSRVLRAMRASPGPVVVSAQGAAVAGACAMLAAADVVVTNRGARLGYPVVRLGISPAVNAPMLAAAVGSGPARARLLDPGLIDGEEALRIGLAHECVADAAGVEPRALAIARELAAKPAHALSATKAWLNHLDATVDDESLDVGLRASLALVGTREQHELLPLAWAR